MTSEGSRTSASYEYEIDVLRAATDIVERLRSSDNGTSGGPTGLEAESADEIERLRSQLKEMAEALSALHRQAIQSTVNDPSNEWGMEALNMSSAALSRYRGE